MSFAEQIALVDLWIIGHWPLLILLLLGLGVFLGYVIIFSVRFFCWIEKVLDRNGGNHS